MTNFRKGIFFLFTSVFLYSAMPVLIRFLGAATMPPASQVFLRYIVAFLCAAVYFRLKGLTFSVKKKDMPILLGIAFVGYALTNLLYTYAILLTQVSTVLFIFYCFSVMTPILGKLFLNERLSVSKIIALVLGFTALLFLFRPGPVNTWKIGALFALASAVAQSIYVIGRKKIERVDSTTILLTNTFVGVVAVGLISYISEAHFYIGQNGITALSSVTWFVTILFGIMNFAAWLFMTRGFALVTAGTGSLVMLSENFIGVLFALLFFSEIPTISTLIGGILILVASVLVIAKGE